MIFCSSYVLPSLLYICNLCFPQLISDANYDLSENYGFRNADVKEEESSHLSNYSDNEGNPALHLCLVLYCVVQNTFISL